MFSWKAVFPKRPNPPSKEQQEEDLNSCRKDDSIFKATTSTEGISGPKSINPVSKLVKFLTLLLVPDSHTNYPEDSVKKARELLCSRGLVHESIGKAENSLKELLTICHDLQHMSEDMRQRVYQMIN